MPFAKRFIHIRQAVGFVAVALALVGCEPTDLEQLVERIPPVTRIGREPPAEPDAAGAQSPAAAEMETLVYERINEIRQQEGLNPLQPNGPLAQVARQYSQRMAAENFFGHVSPTGDAPAQRVSDANILYAMVGENLFTSTNTRREVRQVANEWAAMTSDLIPETLREKAANNTIPTRYIAPLVKEMEKLPPVHQSTLKTEVELNPDLDTLKQVTAEARYLSKYLASANQVQLLEASGIDLELALEEALRVGCLNSAADMVAQAAQIEQTAVKLYTAWKRLNQLAERVFVDSGESTPNLRALLTALGPVTSETVQVRLGEIDSVTAQTIRWRLMVEED
jgi:hypothetical protein